MTTTLAFALAGLGGFNAHGAGFLTASRECNLIPNLITATSGQILILGEWLRSTDLKTLLIDPSRPGGPFGTLLTALTGDPGIFRPAVAEYWRRWTRLPTSIADLSATLFPAQEYVPLRSKSYLEGIAAGLNDTSIGMVFNGYEPKTGNGVLFGNPVARDLLPGETLEAITVDALAAALWLSLYGFEHLPGGRMDGAYHRSCIVAELHGFQQIIAVRPLAQGWRDKLPFSWFDVQDWQTEMWFSASYDAEVADMKRINELIDGGFLNSPKYKKIDLVEIAVDHHAGYFNFFTERAKVFDNAYQKTKELFAAGKLTS